jgi:hypothetical protein
MLLLHIDVVIFIGGLKVHGFGKTTMLILWATEKVWIRQTPIRATYSFSSFPI